MDDLRRSDSGGGTCLAHRLMQRFSSLRPTHAHYVTWSRSGGGDQRGFVAGGACRLSAAAIDAEVESHGYFYHRGMRGACKGRLGSIIRAPSIKTHSRGAWVPAIIRGSEVQSLSNARTSCNEQ